MKVMCIDDSVRPGAGQGGLLKYGEIYTVIDQYPCWHGLYKGDIVYSILELNPDNYQFLASRFAPLSNIDETELIEERQLQTV